MCYSYDKNNKRMQQQHVTFALDDQQQQQQQAPDGGALQSQLLADVVASQQKAKKKSDEFISFSAWMERITEAIAQDFDPPSSVAKKDNDMDNLTCKAHSSRSSRDCGARLAMQRMQWSELVRSKAQRRQRQTSNSSLNSNAGGSSRSIKSAGTTSTESSDSSWDSSSGGDGYRGGTAAAQQQSDWRDLNDLNRLYQHMPKEWKESLQQDNEIEEASAEFLEVHAYPRASELLAPDDIIGLVL